MLEGTGALRIGGEEVEISSGDYAALPTGPAGAHGTSNRSDAPLRYLCFSTMQEPDVAVYPDSDKAGIFGGAAPGGPKDKRTFSKFLRGEAEVGCYEGEE